MIRFFPLPDEGDKVPRCLDLLAKKTQPPVGGTNVIDTLAQLLLDVLRVSSTFWQAPGDDTAIVFHGCEGAAIWVCEDSRTAHHQDGQDVAVRELRGRRSLRMRQTVARRRLKDAAEGGDCQLACCSTRQCSKESSGCTNVSGKTTSPLARVTPKTEVAGTSVSQAPQAGGRTIVWGETASLWVENYHT